MNLLTRVLLFGTFCLSAAIPDARPDATKRTYVSKAIDSLIEELSPLLISNDIAVLLSNCLPNTLDTTVLYSSSDPLDSFIITGDIEALWLRDSANQVIPYIPYASQDSELSNLIEGLIDRHARSVVIDSFANSFNYNASGEGHQDDIRKPAMTPSVFEGKYEIDSLGAFLKLSYWFWSYTGKTSFMNDNWFSGVQKALSTLETMQQDDGNSAYPPYLFQRYTAVATDTLMMSGRGPAARPNGLSRSLFRPSDDAVTLPYNVPGNAMACAELTHLSSMLAASGVAADKTKSIIETSDRIASGICGALSKLVDQAQSASSGDESALPFEVDGFGSSFYMDDANVPSLLSLPVLGYMSPDHPVYQATRKFVLSSSNPFYFTGSQGFGVGGPHVGHNMAWPMALVQQAMTSESDEEITACLDLLVRTAERTGLMHESFNVNNVNDYTRSWFAWANGLFGELVLQLVATKPHLVVREDSIAKAQALIVDPVSLKAQQEVVVKL